jgi:hypothetical protein
MKKIINYIKHMLQDRGGTPNTKLHFGSLFAIVMIIGLFVNVDASLYQTFAFTTLALFGISAVDNISAPKIEVTKTENKVSESKTVVDVDGIVKTFKGEKKDV